MRSFERVLFTVPPSDEPWQLYGVYDERNVRDRRLLWIDSGAPVFTTRYAAELEDRLYRDHGLVLSGPWANDVEYWSAPVVRVKPGDTRRVVRRRYAYRTIPTYSLGPVTLYVEERYVESSIVGKLEMIGELPISDYIAVSGALRSRNLVVAGEWQPVRSGTLEKVRLVAGQYFDEE